MSSYCLAISSVGPGLAPVRMQVTCASHARFGQGQARSLRYCSPVIFFTGVWVQVVLRLFSHELFADSNDLPTQVGVGLQCAINFFAGMQYSTMVTSASEVSYLKS